MRILRALFKVLIGLLITVVVLLGLAVGSIYYVLNRPDFTFPEKSLRWVAANFLKPMDIEVTFKSLQVRLVQTSDSDWYQRQLLVSSEELDVTMPDLLKTHIPDLGLELVLNFHPQRYGIKGIGPIDVSDATFALKLDKPDPRKKSEPFDLKVWMERLRDVKVEPIYLGLQSLTIERPDGLKVISPKIEAILEQDGGNDPYQRRLVVSTEQLDVTMPDLVKTHIPKLDLQLLVNHHPEHYGIKVIGPMDVVDVSVAVKLENPKPETGKKSEPFDLKSMLEPLRDVRIEPIHLGVKSLLIERPDGLKVVSARIDASLVPEEGDKDPYQTRLVVSGEGLDVIMPDLLKTQVPDLNLQVLLNYHPDRYGIKGLGPVDISRARLHLTMAKADPKKDQKYVTARQREKDKEKEKAKDEEPFDYQPWLDRLRQMKFEPMRVELQSLVVERPGEPRIEAQLLANLQRQAGNKWTFSVRADRVKGIPARKANFDVNVDLPEGANLLPLTANVTGRADLGKFGTAQLSGDGRMAAEDVGQVRLNLISNFEGQRQQMTASASLNKEKFALNVSGS
ncbi:MAG: hypothetical protein M3Q07_09845, partial [Pseudobdellovibrionaceae bacterium]|nr:hypothetical protein [Pseudobdellovibrionaceae bacterium]